MTNGPQQPDSPAAEARGDMPTDARLRAALRHAPDHDATPPAAVSARILAAAANAVEPRPLSRPPASRPWARRVTGWLDALQQPAVAAAFGSLVLATVLVIAWRDTPLPDAVQEHPAPLPAAVGLPSKARSPAASPTEPAQPTARLEKAPAATRTTQALPAPREPGALARARPSAPTSQARSGPDAVSLPPAAVPREAESAALAETAAPAAPPPMVASPAPAVAVGSPDAVLADAAPAPAAATAAPMATPATPVTATSARNAAAAGAFKPTAPATAADPLFPALAAYATALSRGRLAAEAASGNLSGPASASAAADSADAPPPPWLNELRETTRGRWRPATAARAPSRPVTGPDGRLLARIELMGTEVVWQGVDGGARWQASLPPETAARLAQQLDTSPPAP